MSPLRRTNLGALLALGLLFPALSGAAVERSPVVATDIPLQGVVLRQALQEFEAGGVAAGGLVLDASPVVAADALFRERANALLGRPISLEMLNGLAAEVVSAYRRAGRPLADAAVPEQNISNGVVQVIVLEARLGQVAVEGARHFSPERIRAAIRTRPGDPLALGTMFADLDWLNRNPFRRVDLVYSRGSDLSTTDVVLRVTEQRPWRLFAGYDNGNVDSLGRDRWFAGVRAGNLWGREHRGSLVYTQAHRSSVFRGMSADYTVPLPGRDELSFAAALAEPLVEGPVFSSTGRSWRVGLAYGGAFARVRAWELGWSAGYEARSTNNDILFGGTNVFRSAYETHEFLGELTARQPAAAGGTEVKAALRVSPGGLGARNDSADLSAAGRDRVGARYAYADLSASHLFPLPRGFGLALATAARVTADRLPSASQYTLGGMTQLPGYSDASASGDGAWWVQLRFQSPILSVWRCDTGAQGDALRLHVAGSFGGVAVNQRTALDVAQGVPTHRRLDSVAVGLNYELSRHLQVGFSYGWQLRAVPGAAGRSSRGHLTVVASF